MTTTRFCEHCLGEREFEAPPCPDGHADCPELACTDCGTGFVTGWLELDAPQPARSRRTAAA